MNPTSSSTAVADAVQRLTRAGATGQPCAPVRDLLDRTDLDAAYQVQSALVAARMAGGARRIGRKIGLTSPAVQAQLGVDSPDFGVLLDDMLVPSGGRADTARLLQPRVEGEIAFRLGLDLDGELSPLTVRAAVDTAHAAIEIVDSRVADWDITLIDTVADNASSGMFVLAEPGVGLAELVPAEVAMTLWRNGEPVSSGLGTACLGDPLDALLWLARTSAAYGDPLRAGEVVLSGALGPVVPVGAGDRVRAELSGLGAVEVEFGPASR